MIAIKDIIRSLEIKGSSQSPFGLLVIAIWCAGWIAVVLVLSQSPFGSIDDCNTAVGSVVVVRTISSQSPFGSIDDCNSVSARVALTAALLVSIAFRLY